MNIAMRIKDYMKETGRTQSYLCRCTNINPSAMSLTLTGKRRLLLEEYCAICKALQVDPDFFLK